MALGHELSPCHFYFPLGLKPEEAILTNTSLTRYW